MRREDLAKVSGRRSKEKHRGRGRLREKKRERLVAQEVDLASDRPAASDRVTRGLGLVVHRWSISTTSSYSERYEIPARMRGMRDT